MIQLNPFIVRQICFGIQDSLISTTGLTVGLSKTGFSNTTVVRTSIISIIVQALSMGYGAVLSEEAFIKTASQNVSAYSLATYAIVMTLSYIVAGIVQLLPYQLNAKNPNAYSIVTATIFLTFLVYAIKERVLPSIIFGLVGMLILLMSLKTGEMLDTNTTKDKTL